jgi:hypothetical protein
MWESKGTRGEASGRTAPLPIAPARPGLVSPARRQEASLGRRRQSERGRAGLWLNLLHDPTLPPPPPPPRPDSPTLPSLSPTPFSLSAIMSGRPAQQKRSVPPYPWYVWTERPALTLFCRLASYIGGGADAPASNVFASFWRSEITNPEKAPGNIKCVRLRYPMQSAESLGGKAVCSYAGRGGSARAAPPWLSIRSSSFVCRRPARGSS